MGFFDFLSKRSLENKKNSEMDLLLAAQLIRDMIGPYEAMNIPSFAACVDLITSTISSVPILLYKVNENNSIEELTNDKRVKLINDDTKDTLTGTQFKKAIIKDYLIDKGGYAYINKNLNEVISLHYIDPSKITFQESSHPIYKDYVVYVQGGVYEKFQFLKVLRNTQNGYKGTSIIQQHEKMLSVVYNALIYENNLVKTGGNKKGFLEVESGRGRLSQTAIDELRKAFNNMYSNNEENVVILNDGIKFKEASNTSVEMQLNENKKTNGNEICKIFHIKPTILNGQANEQDKKDFIQDCIYPILKEFFASLNRDLLLEKEKSNMFFAPDLTEFVQGDIEKRYKAYGEGIRAGFLQLDDVRRKEKLESLNLPYLKLGLQDVLYDPNTKMVFTPNTGQSVNLEKLQKNSNSNAIDDESKKQEEENED